MSDRDRKGPEMEHERESSAEERAVDERLRRSLDPNDRQTASALARAALRGAPARETGARRFGLRAGSGLAAAVVLLLLAAVLAVPALLRKVPTPPGEPAGGAARTSLTKVGEVLVVRRSDGGVQLLRNADEPSRDRGGGRIMITRGERR